MWNTQTQPFMSVFVSMSRKLSDKWFGQTKKRPFAMFRGTWYQEWMKWKAMVPIFSFLCTPISSFSLPPLSNRRMFSRNPDSSTDIWNGKRSGPSHSSNLTFDYFRKFGSIDLFHGPSVEREGFTWRDLAQKKLVHVFLQLSAMTNTLTSFFS